MARFSSDDPGWVDPLPDDDGVDDDEFPDVELTAQHSPSDEWPKRTDPRRPKAQPRRARKHAS